MDLSGALDGLIRLAAVVFILCMLGYGVNSSNKGDE